MMIKIPTTLLTNLFLLLSLTLIFWPVNASRKLDEEGVEKCAPCTQSPPPPPPPSPCPPPPSPPPKKPPPSPPSPTTPYCPPPPLPPFTYITGPPGQQLYPVDQDFNYNGATKRGCHFNNRLFLLIGLMGFIAL